MLANEVDVLAQGVQQVGISERDVALPSIFLDAVESPEIFPMERRLVVLLQVVFEKLEIAVAAENL